MITREQVADLQPGDVVEMTDDRFPDVVVRGPLHDDGDGLYLGNFRCVRWNDGNLPASADRTSLTVVSRAPRLYVNHPRIEPVPGDVVRDADDVVWLHDRWETWHSPDSTCGEAYRATGLEQPLTLLVDGETGQVVP